MKRKNLAKWMVVLVALVAVSTSMIAGTLAKYVSEFSGSDTALVAKWEIGFLGENETILKAEDGEEHVALDLFSHDFDKNIITDAGTDKIIAPGVEGEFTLAVMNKSDVAAKVAFEFEKEGGSADVPLVFSTDETNWVNLADIEVTIANIQAGDADDGTKVYWKWPFDADDWTAVGVDHKNADGDDWSDADDTELGQGSADEGPDNRTEYTLIVKATAEQLPPDITQP